MIPTRDQILNTAFGIDSMDASQVETLSQSKSAFRCSLNNADMLYSLLNAVIFDRKGDQQSLCAHWTISPQGVKITVEKHRIMQARVYLKANSFQNFQVNFDGTENDQSLHFAVNLPVLVDCLSVFGEAENSSQRNVHLDLVMEAPSEPLSIM